MGPRCCAAFHAALVCWRDAPAGLQLPRLLPGVYPLSASPSAGPGVCASMAGYHLLQVTHGVGVGGHETPTHGPVCLHSLLFCVQLLCPDCLACQFAVTSGPPPTQRQQHPTDFFTASHNCERSKSYKNCIFHIPLSGSTSLIES